MNKIIITWGMILYLIGLTGCSVQSNDNITTSAAQENITPAVDWTPVFQAWEMGCKHSEIFRTLRSNLYYFSESPQSEEDLKAKLGKIILPEPFLSNVEPQIELVEQENSRTFLLHVKNGQYHGMALKKIGIYVGNGNGISGQYIEVEQTDAQLRQFFKTIRFERDWENPSEYGHDLANVEVENSQIKVVCDQSM